MENRKRFLTVVLVLALLFVPHQAVQGAEQTGKLGLSLHPGLYKLGLTDHSDIWTLGGLANVQLKYGLSPKFALGVEGDRAWFSISTDGSNEHTIVGASSLPLDWTHVAGTFDGVTLRVFVDGQLDGEQAVAAPGSPASIFVRMRSIPATPLLLTLRATFVPFQRVVSRSPEGADRLE